MATLLNAMLPSDDEADDDFMPELEEDQGDEADRRGAGGGGAKKATRGRKRGIFQAPAIEEPDEKDEEEEEREEQAKRKRPISHRDEERQQRVASVWGAMRPDGAQPEEDGPARKRAKAIQSFSDINALCRPVKAVSNADKTGWMRHLKLYAPKEQRPTTTATTTTTTTTKEAAPPSSSSMPSAVHESVNPPNEDRKRMAHSALANAKAAMSAAGARDLLKVQIKEVRRFAGKEIEVTRLVGQDTKEAAEEAKRAAQAQLLSNSGLDSLLSQYQKKKNLNVLDKTRMDWSSFKKTATGVEEELEEYKKSDKRYLDKVAFLKETELRQYEKERDARLAADVRTRGRV